MNFFRRSDSLLLLPLLLCCCSAPTHAQNDAMVGQSITWQPARSPFTPNASNGAIMGGPGADPNPGAPMYICRARVQNSMVPGKWVQGNCNVAFGGSEQIMRSYEVAYGNARWGAYRGTTYGLAQMGRDIDGSPLFSCRVHYVASGTDYGYQPGKLVPNGTCHIPFGGSEVIQSPPFQVLYATGGGRPPVNPPYNPYPPYPYPPPYYPYPPQVQPYPACNPSTPGVIKDLTSGWWVGPGCSPSDGQGRIMEPKYPPGQQPPNYAPPPPPYQPGPSSVTWQPAQKPFVPGSNAIMGGPGNGPKPDSPLYICRVTYNSNLFPGKWVQGECHFSDDAGKEQTSKTYEVAIGSAQWRDFDGNIGALVPGGVAADGTPLYICRKQISNWGSKKGFQPGYLENGKCHIPYNVDTAYDPPFEALYNLFPIRRKQSSGSRSRAPAAIRASATVCSAGQRSRPGPRNPCLHRQWNRGHCRNSHRHQRRHRQNRHQNLAAQFHRATMYGDTAAGCLPGRAANSNAARRLRPPRLRFQQCRQRNPGLRRHQPVLTRQRIKPGCPMSRL